MTSDNAAQRDPHAPENTSDNTKNVVATLADGEPVCVPTAPGVAFHYCAILADPPACGHVPASALRQHVALPAADVPSDLRCRLRGCRTAYEALEHHDADGTHR